MTPHMALAIALAKLGTTPEPEATATRLIAKLRELGYDITKKASA